MAAEEEEETAVAVKVVAAEASEVTVEVGSSPTYPAPRV